jgi:uncharacterized membrane protein YeaQ/YmgE (transglycosylase-associated protein family)
MTHVMVCRPLRIRGEQRVKAFIPTKTDRGAAMTFVTWILLGLIAGFIGSKLINKTGEGFFLDILLGIVGAVAGGWVFQFFGFAGVTGFNVYSLVVAVVGSMLVLIVYHIFRRLA